jgi:hypothetical protein
LILNTKLPPVKGKDPGLSYQNSDIFIKDYFDRLQNDIDKPITILEGDKNTFLAASGQACHERAFFITEHGRLGIGPRESQIGDHIAVLSGGSMPFVVSETHFVGPLNERNNHTIGASVRRYNLIGASYVHGLMNGEGVVKLGADQYEWIMIDIV